MTHHMLCYLLILITGLLSGITESVASPPKPDLKRLITKLRRLPADDRLISCQFGPDKKSFLLLTQIKKTIGYAEKQLQFRLQFFLINGRRFNEILINGPSIDSLLSKKQDFPPVVRFLPSRNAAIICRQKDSKSDPEIEYWDLKSKKMTSYLKIPFKNCNNQMRFLKSKQILSIISPDLHNKILWNLDSGVPKPISESLANKKCVGFDETVEKTYCFNQDLELSAYGISTGRPEHKFKRPETLAPPFYKTGLWKLSQLVNQKIPPFFDSILFYPPSYTVVSEDHSQIVRWYAIHQNKFQNDGYGLMIWNSTENGEYLRHQVIPPPEESVLENIIYDEGNQSVIAEDFNPARPEFKMITHIKFDPVKENSKGSVSKRIGSPCTHSWSYWPATEDALTCGICDKKYQFNIISLGSDSREQPAQGKKTGKGR